MPDHKNDLFDEPISPAHLARVKQAVSPQLEEYRRRNRRTWLAWLVGGVGFAAAGLGGWFVVRTNGTGEPAIARFLATFDFLALDPDEGSLEEFEILAQVPDMDLDELDEMEILEQLEDEDFV